MFNITNKVINKGEINESKPIMETFVVIYRGISGF